jgi:transcription initiation factor IIE alpha subunit
LADTVAKARAEEQAKAKGMLQRAMEDFNKKESELRLVIGDRDKVIEDLQNQIKQLNIEVKSRDQTIAQRD